MVLEMEKENPYFKMERLPNATFDVYWDNIHIPETKRRMLINSIEILKTENLSPVVAGCSRVVVFYGPPGTGKTTSSKGYANYLARSINKPAILVTLHSHALFNEYLGKTSKTISDAFKAVKTLSNKNFIILLIDEVESILTSRKRASAGDPSDVIRGVNTVLTEIDDLKNEHNTVVLATTNLPEMLDNSFLDRALLKIYFGNPKPEEALKILRETINHLEREMGVRILDKYNLPKLASRITRRYEEGLSGRDIRFLALRTVIEHGKVISTDDMFRTSQKLNGKNLMV